MTMPLRDPILWLQVDATDAFKARDWIIYQSSPSPSLTIADFLVKPASFLAHCCGRIVNPDTDTKMSKRELEQLNGGKELEGPRTKRRRERAGAASPEVDIVESDIAMPGSDDSGQGDEENKESVQEQGLKLLQTVKDAVNKECVSSVLPYSTPFGLCFGDQI